MPINQLAEQYLTTFRAGGADFPGGIAYLQALQQATLDYTPESLGRIDALLDTIHTAERPELPAFLRERANQNFLYFLGFYVGKTIERNNPGATVEWLDHKELVARRPEMATLWPYRFETSVICNVSGGAARQGEFLPLLSIVVRLFEGPAEKSVWFSADAYMAPAAPPKDPEYHDGQPVKKGDALLYGGGLFPGRVEDFFTGPDDHQSLVLDVGHAGTERRLVTATKDELVLVQRNARDFRAACLAWLERSAADPVQTGRFDAAHAQFALGNLYWTGLLVERNVGLAVKLWTRAAAAGDVRAEHELGVIYLEGTAQRADEAKALELLNRAAAKGFARSQSMLGYVYEEGRVVKQDFAAAASWYRKAAAQDDELGLCNLANLFLEGKGVAPDPKQGVELLTRAAAHGSAFAKYRLAMCYERGEGVAQDYAKCVELYAAAAEQDHGPSINNLADKFEHGLGVPQSLQKAFELYQRAAEMDILAAWYSLGRMYEDGRGAPRDRDKAITWLGLAARYQFSDAAERLAALRGGR